MVAQEREREKQRVRDSKRQGDRVHNRRRDRWGQRETEGVVMAETARSDSHILPNMHLPNNDSF